LWVLIFTPVTVLFDALITFAHERNKLYTILDAIVLFNLLMAIFVIPRFVS
jgi:Predicted membrane protein